MASTMPWPPLVLADSEAASESDSKSSTGMGSAGHQSADQGMFLSCSLKVASIEESNLAKAVLRVLSCELDAYGFCSGPAMSPSALTDTLVLFYDNYQSLKQ